MGSYLGVISNVNISTLEAAIPSQDVDIFLLMMDWSDVITTLRTPWKRKVAGVHYSQRGGVFLIIPVVNPNDGYSPCYRRISTNTRKWCVGRSKRSWKSFGPYGYPSTTSPMCFPHYDLKSSRSQVWWRYTPFGPD